MKGIADTGFLVAFANRKDRHHKWAVALAEQIAVPLLTCEPVLAEAAFHLRNTRIVFEMLAEGLIDLAFTVDDNLTQLAELAIRYSGRQPDLADLCLVRMSELYPRHRVVTIDQADFRIYRRNKREVIPLVCP